MCLMVSGLHGPVVMGCDSMDHHGRNTWQKRTCGGWEVRQRKRKGCPSRASLSDLAFSHQASQLPVVPQAGN
jgi:hypothetical protein